MGEYEHYEDTGCDVSPSCFTCPLVSCKYDDPFEYARWRHQKRYSAIGDMWRGGASVEDLMSFYKITRRAVQRVLRREGFNDYHKKVGRKQKEVELGNKRD